MTKMRLACFALFSSTVSAKGVELSLKHITPNVDAFSISDPSKVWYTALSSDPPFKQQYKKGDSDWQDDPPQPLAEATIVPLYINLGGVGKQTTAGKCELNDNIDHVGCFPWKPENTARGEEFTGIPDFEEMIKDNGQEVDLHQASPDSCERRCGNYKYFGLRMVGNTARCWCLSDVRMPRLLSVFEKNPDENLNNAKCNTVCAACSAADAGSTTSFCGSKTHTWIYLRRAQRQLIVLDMSGSMAVAPKVVTDEASCENGVKEFGIEVPRKYCISPFKMHWGAKVLRCLLDKGKKRANRTGIYRIASRQSPTSFTLHSKQLYDYTQGFSNADEVINQWTQEGSTYLWEYLAKEVLNAETPENVNNGKLEIVLFSDGQDSQSSDPFFGGSGFVHLMNELAKKHMYPRFRIVCLDGRELGCGGYREYAVSTGGSYANFESQDGWLEQNTREWRKFCGEASANFEAVPGPCPADFSCGTTSLLKVDGLCADLSQCTIDECCYPKSSLCPKDFACGGTSVLKATGQCKDPSQCTVAECCNPIPGPCPANFVCGNTTALKTSGQCKDKSQCTVAECCNPTSGPCPTDFCTTGTFGAKDDEQCADLSACSKEECCVMQGSCSQGICPSEMSANVDAVDAQCRVPGNCTVDECCAASEQAKTDIPKTNDFEEETSSTPLLIGLIVAGVLLMCLTCFVVGMSMKKKKAAAFEEDLDARVSDTPAPMSQSIWLNPTPVIPSKMSVDDDAATLPWGMDDDNLSGAGDEENPTSRTSGLRQRKSKADSAVSKPRSVHESIADLHVSKPHGVGESKANLHKSRPHGVGASKANLHKSRPHQKKVDGEPNSPKEDGESSHARKARKRRHEKAAEGEPTTSKSASGSPKVHKERKRPHEKAAEGEPTTSKSASKSPKVHKEHKKSHKKTSRDE